MRHRWSRSLVILTAAAIVAAVTWLLSAGRQSAPPSDSIRAAAQASPAASPRRATPTPRQIAAAVSSPPPASPASLPGADVTPLQLSPEEIDAMGAAWASVDMEEVRQAMPDNLYWKLSAPTKDDAVIEERENERSRWNVEYGKILSGTGTEEEIRAFYDQRAKLSGDYIEFATYLVDHYGNVLSERDVNLLKLAMRLHRARIEEIPRKIEVALERRRAQDTAREAWLADQKIFDGTGAESAPDESDAQ